MLSCSRVSSTSRLGRSDLRISTRVALVKDQVVARNKECVVFLSLGKRTPRRGAEFQSVDQHLVQSTRAPPVAVPRCSSESEGLPARRRDGAVPFEVRHLTGSSVQGWPARGPDGTLVLEKLHQCHASFRAHRTAVQTSRSQRGADDSSRRPRSTFLYSVNF